MACRRFARLLLIFAALLLPLQAMAAAAMTLSRPDAAAQAMASAGEHCHQHEAAPDTGRDQDCDNCGICHLACTGYMPASPVTADVAPLAHVYRAGQTAARPSHIPEPPGYPPRRSA